MTALLLAFTDADWVVLAPGIALVLLLIVCALGDL